MASDTRGDKFPSYPFLHLWMVLKAFGISRTAGIGWNIGLEPGSEETLPIYGTILVERLSQIKYGQMESS